jgi:hypothetical protein
MTREKTLIALWSAAAVVLTAVAAAVLQNSL